MRDDIAGQIRQLNLQCEQSHRQGDYTEALKLAREADRLSNQHLSASDDLQLTCPLNVAAVCLALDQREEVETSVRQAINADQLLRTDHNVLEHEDIDRLSVSHRHDLNRLVQLLHIIADWREQAGDLQESANILDDALFYQMLRLGKDHWQVVDLRIKRDQKRMEASLSLEQRSQLDNAIRLNNDAVSLHSQGEFTKALQRLKQAWRCIRSVLPPRHFMEIETLHNVASVYFRNGQFVQADRRFRHCASICADYYGTHHPRYADTLRAHAEVLRRLGDYKTAEQQLREAIEITAATLGQNTEAYALCLNDLAVHFHWAAKYDAAERHYREALAIYEKLNSTSCTYIHMLNNLGELLQRKLDYHGAEAMHRRAFSICQKQGRQDFDYASTIHELANTYHERGNYRQSQEYFRETLRILEKLNGPNHFTLVEPLSNLGQSLRESGEYRQAEACFRRALAIVRAVSYRGDHRQAARLLHQLGIHYFLLHDLDQAESHYREALTIYQNTVGERHPWVASILDDLGSVFQERREFDRALEHFTHAEKIRRESLGNTHRDVALSLNHIGMLHMDQGEPTQAEPYLRQSLEIRRKAVGEDHHDFATSLNNLASCLDELGQSESALTLYQEALRVYERAYGDVHPNLALCLSNLAFQYANRGDWIRVQDSLERALSIEDAFIRHVVLISSESQRLAFLKQMTANLSVLLSIIFLRGSEDQQFINFACDVVLRRKAIAAEVLNLQRETVLKGRYPELKSELDRVRLLRMQVSDLITQHIADDGSLRSARLHDLRRELNRAEADLARKIPEADLERRLAMASRASVTALLPKGMVLIEFVQSFVFPVGTHKWEIGDEGAPLERYFAFVIHSEKPDDVTYVDLGEVASVNSTVAIFMDALKDEANSYATGDASQSAPNRVVNTGRELREMVFDPLLTSIGKRTRLLIAPDGELNTLPFQVLPWEDSLYLIDQYQISYVSSGRDVLSINRLPGKNSREPLVIADPDFDLTTSTTTPTSSSGGRQSRDLNQTLQFPPLPGARTEGKMIARMLGVSPWIGADALEGRLKQYFSPLILHFATHGFFLRNQQAHRANKWRDLVPYELTSDSHVELASSEIENPLLRSGLALAGANAWLQGKQLPSEAEDGLLNAEDVACMNLFDTEVVVLSACETGLGQIHVGEGVFGLRRSFVMAGARTLVMSLWRIPDAETQELMVNFYRRLLAGEDRVEALRQAQIDLRKQFRSPFAWGAFVCHGTFGPVSQFQ